MTNRKTMLIDAPYEDARRTAGVYCLVLWLPRACHITLTRRETCRIERGWYVYTGSARRNLRPRLLRHLRRRKRLHWHIDRLRTLAGVASRRFDRARNEAYIVNGAACKRAPKELR